MANFSHIWLKVTTPYSVSGVIILGKKGKKKSQNPAQTQNVIVHIGIDQEGEYQEG